MQKSETIRQEISETVKQLEGMVSNWNQEMTNRENEFLELKKVATKYEFKDGEMIKLNVGGVLFAVCKETLNQKLIKSTPLAFGQATTYYEPNYFNSLVSGLHNLIKDKDDGSIFIDRDSTYFRYILNYLRSGGDVKNFVLPSDAHALESLFIEARYYSLEGLTDLITKSHKTLIAKYLTEEVGGGSDLGAGFTFGSKPLTTKTTKGFSFV